MTPKLQNMGNSFYRVYDRDRDYGQVWRSDPGWWWLRRTTADGAFVAFKDGPYATRRAAVLVAVDRAAS